MRGRRREPLPPIWAPEELVEKRLAIIAWRAVRIEGDSDMRNLRAERVTPRGVRWLKVKEGKGAEARRGAGRVVVE